MCNPRGRASGRPSGRCSRSRWTPATCRSCRTRARSTSRDARDLMPKDEAIVGETVEALEARAPFRFPREMVIGLLILAVAWQVASLFAPPFIVPGWQRIFASLVKLRADFVLITLARVVAALLLSFALGLGLAVAMYASTPVERYGRPIV